MAVIGYRQVASYLHITHRRYYTYDVTGQLELAYDATVLPNNYYLFTIAIITLRLAFQSIGWSYYFGTQTRLV